MTEVTIGGVLVSGRSSSPIYHTKPAGMRSGYRGARAGSREAGTASFELVFRSGFQDANLWFTTGATVVITVNGNVWFRGVVTGLEKPKRRGKVVPIECAEDSAQLVQVATGMIELGGLENPLGYVWVHEAQGLNIGDDEYGDPITIQSKIFRAGDYFGNALDAARRGFAKQELFDTYGYSSYSGNTGGLARRRLLMYEQPLMNLVRRVLDRNEGAVDGPELTGFDVSLVDSKNAPQMFQSIRTEDDKVLLPEWNDAIRSYLTWGLFTRNLAGQAKYDANLATLYWRQVRISDVDGDQISAVDLYQVLNHGLARKLGVVQMRNNYWRRDDSNPDYPRDPPPPDPDNPNHPTDPDFPDPNGPPPVEQPVHSFEGVQRHGPYPVIKNFGDTIDNTRVAWFWIWGYSEFNAVEDKTYYRRRAVVYDVDLTQPLHESGDTLAYRRIELESFGLTATDTPDWVIAQGEGYVLASSRQPIIGWESARTGGKYEISRATGALGPVFWMGDLYLSEIACEFDGTTLADVLHNLGLATGSEWWVDESGKLIFRKVNRTISDTVVRAKNVFDDTETVRLTQDADGEEISGIPLSKIYAVALREETLKTMIASANRRVIEIRPDHYNFPLGSELVLDGERCGKLVGKECDFPLVKLECEPLA